MPTVVTVQTGKLQLATLHGYVTGYGTVEPAAATADAPAADAQLGPPTAGILTQVNVFEGQHVAKGDVLMELNSAAITLTNAEQQLERQKKLYAEQNTSLKNLQDAQTQLDLLQVVAPLAGTVVHLNAKPGMAVDTTTTVAEIMDLDRLTVNAEIPANADGVKAGAAFQVLTVPDVDATVTFVSPTVNKDNDTILVRAALPGGSGLRPGQFVPIRVVTAVHSNCLAAPAASVVTDESGQSTIAVVKGDEATQTPVQMGLRENGLVEISGTDLKADDTVVTVGAYGLPKQTKIRVDR
jgi:multidrug efflux pump subunit AcrA (membrane-fusion protein)